MPLVAPVLVFDNSTTDLRLYRKAKLVKLRRDVLLYARSLRPGSERNQHRQIGRSLRTLLRSPRWLEANTVEVLDRPDVTVRAERVKASSGLCGGPAR